ncbi:MAG: M48 family metallopeptidase [Bacteroidota bacterium]
MKQSIKILALIIGIIVLYACAKTPFTNRTHAKWIPDAQINAMSFQQYDEFLQQANTINSGPQVDMVKRVGARIQKAAEVYYKANGLEDQWANFDWEFNVVKNDTTVNAFCMPGGKVVFYTGILPIAQDDDGLAVVMGHEVAHALAHHGNERMSQTMGLQGALQALNLAVAAGQGAPQSQEEAARNEQTRQMIMAVAGAGAQVGVLLPFGRKHESEADKIGLYLMAIAGYDLNAASPFWDRMAAGGGARPPEFLSTHPSPETRAANLKAWIPEAREIAKQYPMK